MYRVNGLPCFFLIILENGLADPSNTNPMFSESGTHWPNNRQTMKTVEDHGRTEVVLRGSSAPSRETAYRPVTRFLNK